MNKRLRHLIHRHLDGETSPEERTALQKQLEQNGEFRRAYEELRDLHEILEGEEPVQAPPDLTSKIMAGIRAVCNRQTERRTRHESRRLIPKMAGAFALGICCTILFLVMLDYPGLEKPMIPEHIYGTIGIRWQEDDLLGSEIFDLGSVQGSCSAFRKGRIIGLKVSLESRTPFQTRIDYSPAGLGFEGFRPLGTGRVEMKHDKGRIQTLHSESAAFWVLFQAVTENPDSLHFQLLRANQDDFRMRFPAVRNSVSGQNRHQKDSDLSR